MSLRSAVDRFFRLRWPDGFRCPHCEHHECYMITTRSLPLYQCKLCRRQTTVTSGTVMHKSRTPLDKWAAAIDALSSSPGLCGTRLAALIGVSPKVGWTMLSKFREAMSEAEAARKLTGTVRTGLRTLAPAYIWIFLPFRRYRPERVVALSASVDAAGEPTALKLHAVDAGDLLPEMKEATPEGRKRIMARAAAAHADAQWLCERRRFPDPLNRSFKEARRWLVDVYNGVGTKYLQRYLDEYCFRWNARARGASLRDEWVKLCFPTAS